MLQRFTLSYRQNRTPDRSAKNIQRGGIAFLRAPKQNYGHGCVFVGMFQVDGLWVDIMQNSGHPDTLLKANPRLKQTKAILYRLGEKPQNQDLIQPSEKHISCQQTT